MLLVYILGSLAALGALLAAYFNLLSCSKEMRKAGNASKQRKLQDASALCGFGATILAIMGVAFLPPLGVPAAAITVAGVAFFVLWVAALIHVMILWLKS